MTITCPKCQTDNPDTLKFCGECGTQLMETKKEPVPTKTLEVPREELTTGSTFAGRYQIIEELGRGGMGRVYKATDTKVKEKVALKLIKPEIASDKRTLERFANELRIARNIVHKNVGRMFDINEEEGTHYITMEYVSGQDLKGLIRQTGQLGIGTSLSIAKQICEGLAEAHKIGVIHRDLKPSNIMINREGHVRIMDFGIARSLREKGITGAGVMIGTPEYMSPEQTEGKDVDQRSDIYSLGVILYEMVTGKPPFVGETALSIAMMHKSEIPKDPKDHNAQIPDDLSRLILRCLEKDKDKRYQSAGEVHSEIENIEKGIPTTERKIPERKPLTEREITVTFGLKKLLMPGIALIGVIAAVLVIWQLLPKKAAAPPPPSDKPSLAIMYFKNNTGDASLDHWRTMLSNLLTADLTQSKHIRVLSEDKLFNILEQLNQTEATIYSSEVLHQVAAEGRVDHILQGAYAKGGDEFRINVTLQDANTGELIDSESVSGKGEQSIFAMVDELTRRIKAGFNLTPEDIANDIDKDVGVVTTKSPEAYKCYVEGIGHDIKGEYRQVIESMEKAVAIDPEFASAYLAMSWAYGNLGYWAEEKKYKERALDLSDRLSDREKFLIQGAYFIESEETYDKAFAAFQKLLELYPDDISGNNFMGVLYVRLGERDKAIEYYTRAIEGRTEDVVIFTNLASAYEAKGLFDKAVEVQQSYLNNIRDSAAIHLSLAETYCYQGKYDLALAEADKAYALDPAFWSNIRTKGDIHYYRNEFTLAEEQYRKLLNKSEPAAQAWGIYKLKCLHQIHGHYQDSREKDKEILELAEKIGQSGWIMRALSGLSYTERRQGNPRQAVEELNKVWDMAAKEKDFNTQRETLCDMGIAYLEMKAIDKAQQMADRLGEMVEKAPNKKSIWNHYYLLGMIELAKKNGSQAVEYLRKGQTSLSVTNSYQLLFADALGSAYHLSGDLENAQREYEKIALPYMNRFEYGDIYAKSFYELGRISEERGSKAKAIEQYEKFLDLWKDSDPGIAEVKDAGKKLAVLKTE